MAEAGSKLESLTVHHLQDVRRRLDQIHDMPLRVVDRLGRIERDLTDIKSDVILLENRSLTAATDIIALKQSDEDQQESLARIESKLDQLAALMATLAKRPADT